MPQNECQWLVEIIPQRIQNVLRTIITQKDTQPISMVYVDDKHRFGVNLVFFIYKIWIRPNMHIVV